MVKQLLLLASLLLAFDAIASSSSSNDGSILNDLGYSPTLSPRNQGSDSEESDSPKPIRSNSITLEVNGTVALKPDTVAFVNEANPNIAGRKSPFYAGHKLVCSGIKTLHELNMSKKELSYLRTHFPSTGDNDLMVPVAINASVKGCLLGNDLPYLPLSQLPLDQAKHAADGRTLYLELLLEDYVTTDGTGPRQAHLKVRLELEKYVLQSKDTNGQQVRERVAFIEMLANMRDYYHEQEKIKQEMAEHRRASLISNQNQAADEAANLSRLVRVISAKSLTQATSDT